jgi:hypothetical protein
MHAVFAATTLLKRSITRAPLRICTTGLLFDAAEVTAGWIRFGGVLLALIGMQYFGAGWRDSQLPMSAQASQPSPQPMTGSVAAASSLHASHRCAPLSTSFRYARSFYESTIWSRAFLCIGVRVDVSLYLAARQCLDPVPSAAVSDMHFMIGKPLRPSVNHIDAATTR